MSTGKASGRSSGTASDGTNTSGLRPRRSGVAGVLLPLPGVLPAGVFSPGEVVSADEAVVAGVSVLPDERAAGGVVAPAGRSAGAVFALLAIDRAMHAANSKRAWGRSRIGLAGVGLISIRIYSAKRAMRKPTSARPSLPKSLNASRSSVAVPCSQVEPLMTWNCADAGPMGFAARAAAGTS